MEFEPNENYILLSSQNTNYFLILVNLNYKYFISK